MRWLCKHCVDLRPGPKAKSDILRATPSQGSLGIAGPKKRPRLLDEESKAVVDYPIFQEWYAFIMTRAEEHATVENDKICVQRRLAISKWEGREAVAKLKDQITVLTAKNQELLRFKEACTKFMEEATKIGSNAGNG